MAEAVTHNAKSVTAHGCPAVLAQSHPSCPGAAIARAGLGDAAEDNQRVNPLVRQLGWPRYRSVTPPCLTRAPTSSTRMTTGKPASALADHDAPGLDAQQAGKVKIDLKLLADLRARRGVYSAAQQAQMQKCWAA